MTPHVIVERDAWDYLLGIASLVLAGVAVAIAVWAQWSVRHERRRTVELETSWRVFETFRTSPVGRTQHGQKDLLRGLLRTLRPKDFPLLRLWVDPPEGYEPDNAALEQAIAKEYAEAVERRL